MRFISVFVHVLLLVRFVPMKRHQMKSLERAARGQNCQARLEQTLRPFLRRRGEEHDWKAMAFAVDLKMQRGEWNVVGR
jgi:hypothetical protein